MANAAQVASVVLLYWAVSITLVFANKFLMNSNPELKANNIDAPLFVTWFQCVLTAVIIFIMGRIASTASSDSWLKEFPVGQKVVYPHKYSLFLFYFRIRTQSKII